MPTSGADTREVAIPISLFSSLRDELEKEAGTLPTVRALHRAGYHAGLAAARALHEEAGGDAFESTEDEFWRHLRTFFDKRGWGTLSHRSVHSAVGLLTSPDWAEAMGDRDADPDASCSFSTGFLSGLLSQMAGGPVAVLEVECRTRGGGTCEFAFGSEGAIHELYGRLLEGVDLDGALATL